MNIQIKKLLKNLIKIIEKFSGFIIKIQFDRAKNSDYYLVDRFIFMPFLNKDKEVGLYEKGIINSNSINSDNFYKQCRYYSLVQMAEMVAKKFPTSDIAECGVWKGHSAWMIASIFQENNFEGRFHIFDSFDGGLSKKTIEDANLLWEMSRDEIDYEKKYFSSREAEVAVTLSEFDFTKLYSGWIPERFDDVSDTNFSFVHIDVDLYEPTLDSINFFWTRLIDGGCIIVDDYGSSAFPGATAAVDTFLKNKKVSFFYKVPLGSCILIK